MAIQVPFLSEDKIEKDTELLLAEYEETTSEPVKLPIPVAEITTYHLALRLELADLHETLGIPKLNEQPDIHGAILMDRETVLIDQSLDPKFGRPVMGRYRFSVSHEIGHWRLHRSCVIKDANNSSRIDANSEHTVICRSSQGKERIEWQADFYASCLLMPKDLLISAWLERFGDTDARILRRKDRMSVDEIDDPDMRCAIETFQRDQEDKALQISVRPFAEQFQVSPIAMLIRLEKLKLLRREFPWQKRFAGSA